MPCACPPSHRLRGSQTHSFVTTHQPRPQPHPQHARQDVTSACAGAETGPQAPKGNKARHSNAEQQQQAEDAPSCDNGQQQVQDVTEGLSSERSPAQELSCEPHGTGDARKQQQPSGNRICTSKKQIRARPQQPFKGVNQSKSSMQQQQQMGEAHMPHIQITSQQRPLQDTDLYPPRAQEAGTTDMQPPPRARPEMTSREQAQPGIATTRQHHANVSAQTYPDGRAHLTMPQNCAKQAGSPSKTSPRRHAQVFLCPSPDRASRKKRVTWDWAGGGPVGTLPTSPPPAQDGAGPSSDQPEQNCKFAADRPHRVTAAQQSYEGTAGPLAAGMLSMRSSNEMSLTGSTLGTSSLSLAQMAQRINSQDAHAAAAAPAGSNGQLQVQQQGLAGDIDYQGIPHLEASCGCRPDCWCRRPLQTSSPAAA